ncbi:uncharacterized protein LOC102192117 [Pundamilia nyererei]|uniref:Uncharacterized protein LOC102192117 n=1 Tax=Pundamilia nyererei TaxID=303518 RepID=A0A9Y6J643_9CICH|nr:PREDICTED: uncharacterized protein LOC102192117 [Pundamilia nyererei]
MLNHLSIRAVIVNLMVDELGQQSVEVTREVFMHMNRTDLVQKLPESSSASREKHSVDEHGAALLKRDEALAVVEQIILETLKDLSHKEIKKFRLLVLFTCSKIDLPEMEKDTTDKVVHHMVDELGLQSLEVTRTVLRDMNKTDLAQRLLELTKRFKGQTKRSLKPEQDCSDWTKLEPEVNSTDADEAPTYSLQSAAGHFECRVSGLPVTR